MVKSTAGTYLKSLINSDFYHPKKLKDIVENIEITVRLSYYLLNGKVVKFVMKYILNIGKI